MIAFKRMKRIVQKQCSVFLGVMLLMLFCAKNLNAQDVAIDSLKSDVVTTLEVGKTYVIGKQYDMCKVSFTAPADGFLSITPSQKVNSTSLKINGASSTFTKVNGGIEKKGMAKGSVFEGTFYTSGTPSADNTYALVVTFEEGTPYEPLTMTLANPAQGGEWSGAAQYKTYGTKGVPHFEFSSVISADVVATVTIGGNVYSPVKCTVDSYNPKMDVTGMPEIMTEAIAAGLLKAGDSFTLTLTDMVDKEFTVNTLKDTTFTYTLASTACTGVTPAASTSRTVLPEEVVFSFDGNVNIDNAKFYFVNKNTGANTELTEAVVEGTSVKITVPTLEGLLPKLYDIVAEGVTDESGKVITYGTTEGQLTVSYGTGNGYFKPVMEPANYAEVSNLKTYTATLPGAVVYDGSQASSNKISFSQLDGNSGWVEMENISVSYEINENVITFTLSEEITTPGDYRFEVPGKLFWSKDLYDAGNLSTSTCYYMASQYITCTVLPYGPTTVTPANGSTVNRLNQITLSFDEAVDFDDATVVTVLKETVIEDDWWGTVQRDTVASVGLGYDYANDKNIIVNLGSIGSAGTYAIVVPEGSIWTEKDKNKKIGEWTYTYDVDPDYWDPEWVVEVGTNCTEEAPCQLIAGRKYNFTEMYSYTTFTATETGRVYLTAIEGDMVGSFWMSDADWVRSEYPFNFTDDGRLWFGVVAGETYYIISYGFGSRTVEVTFDGSQFPFESIAYISTNPADGGFWSKSVRGQYSNVKGAVEFVFTHDIDLDVAQLFVVLPSKDNKEINVTNDVYTQTGHTNVLDEYYVAFDIRDIIEDIKKSNGLEVGDKIQIVLKNVQDANFADNKLESDFKVELTLAATVCTSVSPDCEYDGVDAIPTEISLQFDGNVTCAKGTGYIIDVKSGNRQEFTFENLICDSYEHWDGSIVYTASVSLPKATIELTSRRFDVLLEGLVDDENYAVSYGNEVGKFIIEYSLRADTFLPVLAVPEEGGEVTSIKTTILTFAEDVHINPEAKNPYIYVENDVVTGIMEIDPNNPNSVIITWAEEITASGAYYINIDNKTFYDSKFDMTKQDYGVTNGASYNPYISYVYYIPADISATTVSSITPIVNGFGDSAISQLPEEVVIEFEGNVKEVISAYGKIVWSDLESASLQSRIEGNKIILDIPTEHIEAIIVGDYTITVNALGEDGKPVGYAIDYWGDIDPYAEYISFSYYVEKNLELVSVSPANGSVVRQLDEVVLTFNEDIFEVDYWYGADLWDESGEFCASPIITFEGNVATLKYDFAPYTQGNYNLVVCGGLFLTDKYITNKEIKLTLTIDPNYQIPVESLVSLVAEAVAWKAELNPNDEMHAQVLSTLEQMIPAAQAVADEPESVEQVEQMIFDVNFMLGTYKPMIAKYDAAMAATSAADEAQALYDSYKNPSDNAGFATAILNVREGVELLNDIWESVSIEELASRVEVMKEAQEAFVAENVKVYIPADVNGDGNISVVDVVAVVNNILGRNVGNFIFEAADMDGNGEISVVDVVAVVNTVLGRNVSVSGARSILRSNLHVADAEVNAGESTTLYVKLDNAQAYTAMQMDVALPEGLSIEGVEMVGNASHTVAYNEEGRIAAYSLGNSRFQGGEALMAITVKADEGFMGTANVDFTNVRVVSTDVVETVLADAFSTVIGGAKGIDCVEADDAVQTIYYTVDGAASDAPHKGLNIIKRIHKDGRVEVDKVMNK